MANGIQIGIFPPVKVASRMEEIRVTKADLNTWMMVALAMLTGAFVGIGAAFLCLEG